MPSVFPNGPTLHQIAATQSDVVLFLLPNKSTVELFETILREKSKEGEKDGEKKKSYLSFLLVGCIPAFL